jgi:rubredoxin-NAD+ reductase
MQSPLILVGAGLAAYTLAREFRKLDPDAPVTLVTADAGDYYSKPMLSNALAGKKSPAALVLKPAAQMAAELGIALHAQTRVTHIDRVAHRIETTAGTFDYGTLVLATGAQSIRPSFPGSEHLLTVNHLDDYTVLRTRLEGAHRVVVLGAGLIGCEFGNDLRLAGLAVTLVDPAPWPLARMLPEAAGRWFADRLRSAGIDMRCGTQAVSLAHGEGGYVVTLADGTVLNADVVLAANGLQPDLTLALASGLAVGRGIRVDRSLRSTDRHIYALGDCAEVDGWVLPYVMPIMHGARALAATLAGQQNPVHYPAMPVVVKTPACPAVVSPVPMGVEGEWSTQIDDAGVMARFSDATGQLRGFALLGAATAQRQALSAQVPDWLPAAG